MSDPYLDKLYEQRAVWVHEMISCPECLANPNSRTPIVDHIWDHKKPAPAETSAPKSDAMIEYDHDAPSDHYPYKSRGMDDAAAMHPSRWKQPAETMPGSYAKTEAPKEPEMGEVVVLSTFKVSTKLKRCETCGENYRLWSVHIARCGKGAPDGR
jgi:hypothetical protein